MTSAFPIGPPATGLEWPGRAPAHTRPWRGGRGFALTKLLDLRGVERAAAFGGPLALYLVLGSFLAFKYHSWFGDAQARLANAYYVLYSRDPHLAAVGFVWNPGTSLAELPLLLLKPLFPALATDTFAAVIVSASAMAAAGYHVFRFAEEQGLGRLVRWAILIGFVANPMTLYFGANGMSEALFTLTLVASARYLAQWLREPATKPLVYGGLSLGAAYLVRNEALAAAGLATVVVLGASYIRAQGTRRTRRLAAGTDATIFAMPFVLTFACWTLASWVIVGHPFEQYASAYGTSSQLKLLNLAYGSKSSHLWWVLRATLWLVPSLPVLLYLAMRGARRHRDASIVAVLAVLGGVVAFECAAYTMGQIAWALRYVVYAIPFTAMLAACAARPEPPNAPSETRAEPRWILSIGRRSFVARSVVSGFLGVGLFLPTALASEHTLIHSQYDRVDQQNLNFVLSPSSAAAKANPYRDNWRSVRQEAGRLDAMRLGNGAIMVDNFSFCVPNLILQSKHPKQFMIPNDQDFVENMGAPYQAGVRYFLVPEPTQLGLADALNREWPTLYADGAGLAHLVETIKMSGCLDFRMYKLIPTST